MRLFMERHHFVSEVRLSPKPGADIRSLILPHVLGSFIPSENLWEDKTYMTVCLTWVVSGDSIGIRILH
jgi:hypothetical protein